MISPNFKNISSSGTLKKQGTEMQCTSRGESITISDEQPGLHIVAASGVELGLQPNRR